MGRRKKVFWVIIINYIERVIFFSLLKLKLYISLFMKTGHTEIEERHRVSELEFPDYQEEDITRNQR